VTEDLAEAIIDSAFPKYRSDKEEEYAILCEMLIDDWLQVRTLNTQYEPAIWLLPGGLKYKPDFMHILEDRRILFVEVKNSKKQKGYRVTRNKLVTATALYPYFMWAECIADRAWKYEVIG